MWALGSTTMNKAGGTDGIPVELFQILKDDAVKVLHSIYWQIWKTQQWPQDWKRSVFNPKERQCQRMLKLPHNCTYLTCQQVIMFNILQARLQQYLNWELPYVQDGFRKGRGTRDQIANIHWIREKSKSSRKTSTSALLTSRMYIVTLFFNLYVEYIKWNKRWAGRSTSWNQDCWEKYQ